MLKLCFQFEIFLRDMLFIFWINNTNNIHWLLDIKFACFWSLEFATLHEQSLHKDNIKLSLILLVKHLHCGDTCVTNGLSYSLRVKNQVHFFSSNYFLCIKYQNFKVQIVVNGFQMCFFPLYVVLRAVSDCRTIQGNMGKRNKKNRNNRNQQKKVKWTFSYIRMTED